MALDPSIHSPVVWLHICHGGCRLFLGPGLDKCDPVGQTAAPHEALNLIQGFKEILPGGRYVTRRGHRATIDEGTSSSKYYGIYSA